MNSTPYNPLHMALQNRVCQQLAENNILFSSTMTYHECLESTLSYKLSKSTNSLARQIRHLPDILVFKEKLIGLDIKTNPDRNICIELLPVLEALHLADSEPDNFYIYTNGDYLDKVKVIPLHYNSFPKPDRVIITKQPKELEARLKYLLDIYFPKTMICTSTRKSDPCLIVDIAKLDSLSDWDSFLEELI